MVAALTPLSVDGMIVAASTTLLAESRSGSRGGVLPWSLLAVGSMASLAANVAVAQPTITGRFIAAWPSFALICSYELLMRHVRRTATNPDAERPARKPTTWESRAHASDTAQHAAQPAAGRHGAGPGLQREAWRWAQQRQAVGGSLLSGREIASATVGMSAGAVTSSASACPEGSPYPATMRSTVPVQPDGSLAGVSLLRAPI